MSVSNMYGLLSSHSFSYADVSKQTSAGKTSLDSLSLGLGSLEEPDGEELSFQDMLQLEEESLKKTPSGDASSLSQKSLYSMMMESLFLAELEESSADDAATTEASGSEGEQTGAEAAQVRSGTAKASNPLQDGEKAASIKKVLSDFSRGKADVSDMLKAMTVSNGGGGMKSAAEKNQSATLGGKAQENKI